MNVSENLERAVVPYIEPGFIEPPKSLDLRRVVKPSVVVKSLFVKEFDSGADLKDIG